MTRYPYSQSARTGDAPAYPRPFGDLQASPPLFLAIIVRDLQASELESVSPSGLCAVSSWTEPAGLSRTGPPSPLATAWV